MREHPFSEERRKKIGDATRGRKHTLETRQKISAALKGRPELLIPMAKGRAHASKFGSKLETIIAGCLRKLNVHYQRHKAIGHFNADFYLREHAVDLECNGNYWHSLPGRKKAEKRKRRFLKLQGIQMIVITETAIKKDPMKATKAALRKAGVL
jgi:very-short-patch-repair endonuclease